MNDISQYEKIPEVERDFPVKIMHSELKYLRPHWHEHVEILHIIAGTAKFTCASETFCAGAGDTVVVNSNELHTFTSNETLEYICLIMNISFFNDADYENILLQSKIPHDDNIHNYVYNIYRNKLSADPGSNMIIKGNAYLLLGHMCRYYAKAHLSDYEYGQRMAKLEKINGMLEYIHQNYSENLSTAVLAKKWYLSESYICHIFKKATGKTIIRYINDVRVEKAALLLQNTADSVSEISMNVGFEDANYFNRMFKARMGVSPKRYRNLKETAEKQGK